MASFFIGTTTAQVSVLTTDQLASLSTADYAGISTDQVRALTTDQLRYLKTSQVVALTTASVAALTTDQTKKGLTTDQVGALTTAQVSSLTTDQVSKGLTTDQTVALTTAQVGALTTAQVQSLVTDQVRTLETRDVAALKTNQVQAFSTDQIRSFTTDQLTALTTGQVMALTTDQKAALTTDQITKLAVGSPIVLDLDGNGITTQSVQQGLNFDIFGVGQKVQSGWVSGGDGLLVMDRNHDGTINGGGELFGEGTVLSNGSRAANGYAALTEMDENSDGIISAADANFANLMVWVDSDADGISQTTELLSLSALGITQLNLTTDTSSNMDNGNLIGLTSTYTTIDGTTHDMADVWFATKAAVAAEHSSVETPIVSPFNAPVPLASAVPIVAAAPANAIVQPDGLNLQVEGLVDALVSFGKSGLVTEVVESNDQVKTVQSLGELFAAPGDQHLAGIVDAMKQFDTNGRLTHLTAVVPLAGSLTPLGGASRPNADNDFLAAPKS